MTLSLAYPAVPNLTVSVGSGVDGNRIANDLTAIALGFEPEDTEPLGTRSKSDTNGSH